MWHQPAMHHITIPLLLHTLAFKQDTDIKVTKMWVNLLMRCLASGYLLQMYPLSNHSKDTTTSFVHRVFNNITLVACLSYYVPSFQSLWQAMSEHHINICGLQIIACLSSQQIPVYVIDTLC